MRNQVIHSYGSISGENIWAIVISNLPALKKDVDKLI
ncbi:MAG: DUF86 domain-containing protein [Prevotellaceae bacterium]|nr:DUF86 domain-containing protein [Prevotellaceae bacterium]